MTSASTWSGAEFVQRSEAVQEAQHIAVNAVEDTARNFGDQVIGVEVALRLRESGESAMSSMHAIGTAVRRFRDKDEVPIPDVLLRLSDKR